MAVETPSSSSSTRGRQRQQLWGHQHLPLLVGASSKDSVEYILQALWRTRNTGLDSADRSIFRDILHLPSDSDLDPLLVCLRMLIRRCVYENTTKEEIQKLFPEDVSPELQKLLTLLLLKFQSEWKDDVLKDKHRVDKEALQGETGGNFVSSKGDQASDNATDPIATK
ncbi:COMM domain-containing protein 9 [Rhynchospora pubera]|uniref:COMM domain-containing protein 9 n=1 Tax=Rhynchospora pubera TaxID=906938 RepID=A0AAV8EKB4_9POAL|nr:COMM domain-containing protein 9 [Rhynchospora pubera]